MRYCAVDVIVGCAGRRLIICRVCPRNVLPGKINDDGNVCTGGLTIGSPRRPEPVGDGHRGLVSNYYHHNNNNDNVLLRTRLQGPPSLVNVIYCVLYGAVSAT